MLNSQISQKRSTSDDKLYFMMCRMGSWSFWSWFDV